MHNIDYRPFYTKQNGKIGQHISNPRENILNPLKEIKTDFLIKDVLFIFRRNVFLKAYKA